MPTTASKLNISKVGRVCVTTADTDRALDFYVGTLGFEKVVDEPMGPGMRWVEVKVANGETTIAIAPPPPDKQVGGRRDRDHLRHERRRRSPFRPQGGGRRRRRRSHPLRRERSAHVLAP